ncbi:MAG: dihydroorotase [bacterium]
MVIRGGRVIDPGDGLDEEADLFIEDGRIKEIRSRKARRDISSPPGQTLDATGKVVLPGLIDMHVHLREPGREDEETILSGAEAAVAGGFTGVACMPNTEPPVDDESAVRFILRRAEGTPVRVYPVAAATKGRRGQELTEIADLVGAGAVAVSDDGTPVSDPEIMRRALEYTRMYNIPVVSHCEELSLTAQGVMNEGRMSTVLGLRGMPPVAEEIMVARDIALAEYTGGRLHIAHVSTARSVELIRQAKSRGVNVTTEATPHHFTLTEEALRSFDTNLKMNPPLRAARDVEAIREGLADGTIDAIASDHAPHSVEEKEVEFDAAPFGIIGLETTLALVLTELVSSGVLSLPAAVAKLSTNPALIFGIEGGHLRKGDRADVTVIDPTKRWTVDVTRFRSKSRNSPFGGRELTGGVEAVIVGGKIVYRCQD